MTPSSTFSGEADGSEPILGFAAPFDFLSNFYPAKVTQGGQLCASVEHAYQAEKTLDAEWQERIRSTPDAQKAKRIARKAPLRSDWEAVKVDVMRNLLAEKFSWPRLRRLLLETADRPIVEMNHWGDEFWGMVQRDGALVGTNMLGRLLMELRAALREAARTPVTLIAFDLEATCWDISVGATPAGALPEVIEIGAVAWRSVGEQERPEFQAFVRPVEQPLLSDFCRALTTIQQDDVDSASGLGVVMSEFFDWCASHGEYLLVSWGQWDANQLRGECSRKGVALRLIESRHLNLKEFFSRHRGPRHQIGLGKAAEKLGIAPAEPAHRAIADARTVAAVLDCGLGELARASFRGAAT